MIDILKYMGVPWDIEYYSDPEEVYIESIKINGGDELVDEFTEKFIAGINLVLIGELKKEAKRNRGEDAGQHCLEAGGFNYG